MPNEEIQNSPASNDSMDVDSLLAGIEGGDDYEIPMTQNEIPTTGRPQGQDHSPQVSPTPTELVLKGKDGEMKIPFSDPRITQWAQQGRDYAQSMADFNQQKAAFKAEQERVKAFQETYGPIDEWAAANPDQWQKFTQSFNQFRQNPGAYQPQAGAEGTQPPQGDQNNPLAPYVDAITKQLEQKFSERFNPVAQNVQDLIKARELQKTQEEDRQLDAEIAMVKKQYASIDFNTPNADGKSLETLVLEHGAKNGIKNFNTAFRDFYHENLMRLAEERGKEAVSKDLQKRTKLGLLGESPTPKKGLQEVRDIKGKSYDDLLRETYAELGIG